MIEMLAAITVGITIGYVARYYWLTRRQPIRKDAPTHGPWVRPRSWR